MTQFLEWLLDLEGIRLARDAPLLLRWERSLDAWLLVGIALLTIAFVVAVYRRERASTTFKVMLVSVRVVLLALVAAVLCHPSLVLQRDRVDASYVALVLDTSLSMEVREPYADASAAASVMRAAGLSSADDLARHSRLELTKASLLRAEGAALRSLLQQNDVQLCTFDDHVEVQGRFEGVGSVEQLSEAVDSVSADGATTDVGDSLRQVLGKARGRRLAAIVLATDGQSTRATDFRDALDEARDRHIPVFALRVGTTTRPVDLEVQSVRAQEHVFVRDVLAVEATVSAKGLQSPIEVHVQMVDERSGKRVASEDVTLTPGAATQTIELRTKPIVPGTANYRVVVADQPGERTLENNFERVSVEVTDSQLRVLLVAGYPRYEYRYLKNALLRESSVSLSVLLIEADERFVQEGTDPIRRFPQTPEELNRYDVVIFGDVDPRGGWLTLAQMTMLLDFVGNHGGGFGLIAGERAAPFRFLGTPLERLIPVRIDRTFSGRYESGSLDGFRPRLTPDGRRSRVLRFVADREENVRLVESLPNLFWYSRTLGAKPGATVLADYSGGQRGSTAAPIIVVGRYGAGRLFFQATDDTWRWRRHAGELLHDSYWVQVVRDLTRGSRVDQDRRFVLRADRRVYGFGAGVRVQMQLFDAQLLAQQGDTVTVVASVGEETALLGSDESAAIRKGPAASSIVDRFVLHRLGPESDVLEGAWVPPRPGRYSLAVADVEPLAGAAPATIGFRVEPPALESQNPQANHDVLTRVAGQTGGRVVELDELAEAFAAIGDRSVRIPDDLVEPLWDSKLPLILFALMISIEWGLRKASGLL